MNEWDWFSIGAYAVFDSRENATRRSSPHNIMWWIITQFKGFMRKGIAKVSRSMEEYEIYLFLTSQVLTRSNIVGNWASAMNAQKIFNIMSNAMINEIW